MTWVLETQGIFLHSCRKELQGNDQWVSIPQTDGFLTEVSKQPQDLKVVPREHSVGKTCPVSCSQLNPGHTWMSLGQILHKILVGSEIGFFLNPKEKCWASPPGMLSHTHNCEFFLDTVNMVHTSCNTARKTSKLDKISKSQNSMHSMGLFLFMCLGVCRRKPTEIHARRCQQ